MKLKIASLYYDILNTYGDIGNVIIFEKILKDNNLDYELFNITLNDSQDISDFDFVFIGGGTDNSQKLIYQDLITRKKQFQTILNNNGFILAICGAYQLFGKEYLCLDGTKIPGVNIFDFTTIANENRANGKIIIDCKQLNTKIVGYENHAGYTYDVNNPLGKTLLGLGNNEEKNEGFLQNNFLGTYVHGPLLSLNPEIGKYMLEQVLYNKYKVKKDIQIKSKYYQQGKEEFIKENLC